MRRPNVCVLRAPGTNCDVETAFAFERCGARAERVHLFRALESPHVLAEYQILCIPGGFSYGDDIGAGVIFSRQLRGRLDEAIREFLTNDKLALGICNGFQVLLKAGILPDGAEGWTSAKTSPSATLTWNDNGKYTACWVRLAVVADHNVFLRGLSEIELPVAHAEGKIVVRDESVLRDWRRGGRIALCYAPRRSTVQVTSGKPPHPTLSPEAGERVLQSGTRAGGSTSAALVEPPLPYPDNPNGSAANIAGLSDSTGRVLGLMPHPERFIFATQHPQWTRRTLSGDGDGLKLFRNAVEYFGG